MNYLLNQYFRHHYLEIFREITKCRLLIVSTSLSVFGSSLSLKRKALKGMYFDGCKRYLTNLHKL
jgi:hypothetical protein